jgi:1-acyl-sn-glycerol-3-phosphate acyltransferase
VDVPVVPPSLPREGGPLTRALGRWALRVTGWRFEGAFPDLPKAVVIVAPHTSNWDFAVGLAAKFALGLRSRWVGKHTLFRWPVGGLLRRLGGMPVDRSAPQDLVQQVIHDFATSERMLFTLAPEGTRKRVPQWKSGYWRIAREAGVPIVLVGFDFAGRRIVIRDPLWPTDSLEQDEAELRRRVTGIAPRHPALYVP